MTNRSFGNRKNVETVAKPNVTKTEIEAVKEQALSIKIKESNKKNIEYIGRLRETKYIDATLSEIIAYYINNNLNDDEREMIELYKKMKV